MSEQLRIIGQDKDDVPVVSALLQDAAVRIEDLHYDPKTRRFVALVNRYRWEASVPTRVRSALRIDGVIKAQRCRWPQPNGTSVLELLAVTTEGEDKLILHFAGGATIRLSVECIELCMEDLTGAWGARTVPRHPEA